MTESMTMASEEYSPMLITGLLFGPLLLGITTQKLTEPPARKWHTRLHKSPYRPPNIVFPIAWIWCYVSMGYASYLTMLEAPDNMWKWIVGCIYGLHLIMLNSWGWAFFVYRRMDWGLNIMVTLDVLTSTLLIAVSTLVPFAAVLCLPYFGWLLELTYLNIYMFRNNDQMSVEQIGEEKKESIECCVEDEEVEDLDSEDEELRKKMD